MAEIVDPILEVGTIVGVAPADGIVGAIAGDGTVKILEAWDPVQGDVTHSAPAGSVGGGGTRRHLFDRELYVDTGGAVYVNIRAFASITGKPTTVQGYGITNAIRTDLGATQNIDNALTLAGALTITTNATYFTGKTAGAVAKRLIGVNASGLVAIDADAVGSTFGAGLVVAGTVSPSTDNARDLGDGSHRWRDLYLAGTLSVGSISTSGGFVSTQAGAGNNVILSATSATTGNASMKFTNTSGQVVVGVESSAGATLFAGTAAYSAVFGTGSARSLHFVTNNVVRQTISSAGVVTIPGALSLGSDVDLADSKVVRWTSSGATIAAKQLTMQLYDNAGGNAVFEILLDGTRVFEVDTAGGMSVGYGNNHIITLAPGANETVLMVMDDAFTLKRVKMEAAAGGKRHLYVDE